MSFVNAQTGTWSPEKYHTGRSRQSSQNRHFSKSGRIRNLMLRDETLKQKEKIALPFHPKIIF